MSSPLSATGAVLAEYAGWGERVSVVFADPANPMNAAAMSTLKKITVTVTAPSKKTYTLVGWRSKFGAYEAATATSPATLVTGVSASVQTPATKTVYTGAHPLNGVTP